MLKVNKDAEATPIKVVLVALLFRSSRSHMFFKIGILQNYSNFTRERLCWSFFLVKLQTCQNF